MAKLATNNIRVNKSLLLETHSVLLTKRCVYEHSIVELGRGGSNMDGLHLFEAAEGVTFGDEFCDGALVEGAGDEQNDVVNHVAVPEIHINTRNLYTCN